MESRRKRSREVCGREEDHVDRTEPWGHERLKIEVLQHSWSSSIVNIVDSSTFIFKQ